jgi:glutamine synthetase
MRFCFSENEEIVKFVSDNNIKIANLCHIPEDGRLKTLSFSTTDKKQLLEILNFGERVDGSSLFSFIEPGQSDIYIKPKTSRVFINPFATVPTLNILCDYLDEKGNPLDIAPANVLKRAEKKMHSSAGFDLKAMCELEFYIMSRLETQMLFEGMPDKNYHESAPFARFEDVRNEIMVALASVGIATKYGHSEAGRIWTEDNMLLEQHEIELIPKNMVEMAETLAIAKWIVRNVCSKHGVSASFSPKVAMAHAGSGMHIHMCGIKDNENVLVGKDGALSDCALEMIGGILRFAPSLAAFGNTVPISYLRFISTKESPISICWGARNRLALIRIPLWWNHMIEQQKNDDCRRTFEYRAPDAFANTYLILAALAISADYGVRNPKDALKVAQDSSADANSSCQKGFKALPCSCNESADNLEADRRFYEADDVFPTKLVDKTIEKLKAYDDRELWKELDGKPHEVDAILKQYLHYG